MHMNANPGQERAQTSSSAARKAPTTASPRQPDGRHVRQIPVEKPVGDSDETSFSSTEVLTRAAGQKSQDDLPAKGLKMVATRRSSEMTLTKATKLAPPVFRKGS